MRNINDLNGTEFSRFFDDDGNEINMSLIKKPSLCIICKKNLDPNEEVLCAMNMFDQEGTNEFYCDAFEKQK